MVWDRRFGVYGRLWLAGAVAAGFAAGRHAGAVRAGHHHAGQLDEPVAGVHNSGWVPSPGLKLVTDRTAWPDLRRYVTDVVGSFRNDQRVSVWDLYNEPGNSNLGNKSLPLVEAVFAWARAGQPRQPLTIGAWADLNNAFVRRSR